MKKGTLIRKYGTGDRGIRELPRRAWNRLLHLLARFLPGATTLRPYLHRLRGVKDANGVFIGDEVYLENENSEAIELQKGALIGLRSTIVAHPRRAGRVVVGKNAVIGAGTLITCAGGKNLGIGEGAVIGAGSVVANSFPPFTFCGTSTGSSSGNYHGSFHHGDKLSRFLARAPATEKDEAPLGS